MRMNGRRLSGRLIAVTALLLAGLGMARAQTPAAGTEPIQRDQPAFYQADTATYDRDAGLVTLTGHVEFWQNDRILMADKVTYDRTTNVAAATGHVVLMEPTGQTVFSDYAELSQGMKDGILSHMSAILAENGKLVANGARRTDGKINELSRVVYSTCNLCAQHPERAPLWQIRARSAVQDLEHKSIEYKDAVIDIFGVPVLWLPYLTHPDPSEKRASGFLVPNAGYSQHLGAFAEAPYYWVLDPQSDVTLTPIVASHNGPALEADYRRVFNNGKVTINASVARDNNTGSGTADTGDSAAGHIFATGQFAIDDTWRWGFNVNRASSADYMRDFDIAGRSDVLASSLYLEGFGQGSYSKLDTLAFQSLTTSIKSDALPLVLPRYEYSFTSQPTVLGGRISVDAGAFNVERYVGTSTQRASFSPDWSRQSVGRLGDVWTVGLHVDSAGYNAERLDEQPNYSDPTNASSAQAMVTGSAEVHLPMLRQAGKWGAQVIEPIAQLLVAPRGDSYVNSRIPDEDSLDQEFTDANLFSVNRFAGIDRLEGGVRANVALHGAWYMPGGASFDAQIGQGYRLQKDSAFSQYSGLQDTVTDVVSHVSFTPNKYFDITSRQRFDHRNMNVNFVDALATTGPSWLRLNGGYIYTNVDPYLLFTTPPTQPLTLKPRNEVALGLGTSTGPWHFSVDARRDLQTSKMVSLGADAKYEDECFAFDVSFSRRYTSLDDDTGDTTLLFQITLKTVGEFGFHAL